MQRGESQINNEGGGKEMTSIKRLPKRALIIGLWLSVVCAWSLPGASAQPLPGGTLDPTQIEKYVIPLVIPPVMNNDGETDSYDITVRQFQQQILPGGIWNALGFTTQNFPATTVWSYGPAGDPLPDSAALGGAVGVAPAANSQFNYPAYIIETETKKKVKVRWINGLVDETSNFLPHLLPVDQTLHWANPPKDCRMGDSRTDCHGENPLPYDGPVPIVTHVHGAHVDPHSDGYPEAWWLPAANNIPPGYATEGSLFDDAKGQIPSNSGYADFEYRNDQPATTLWYHDHTLGMTRLNVYAGPAGFWLIRGGSYDKTDNVKTKKKWDGILPGPAPKTGQDVLSLNTPGNPVRNSIREIPIVIQDRSFNEDGSLFYPDNRAFFEGLNVENTVGTQDEQFPDTPELRIPFVPVSDIAPIWNPEAFFNVMVVNGVSWPQLKVAPALYRFRFLNGCNSRFLILRTSNGIPFYQIGGEQGFLSEVAELSELLMGPAERADVIMDFRSLGNGTEIELLNVGPDEPFGGGEPDGDFDAADPGTTGMVMRFVVDVSLNGASPTDPAGETPATDPAALMLRAEKSLKSNKVRATRQVSLNEGASEELCVQEDGDGNLVSVAPASLNPLVCPAGSEPFAPKEALLGTVDFDDLGPFGIPLKWTDETKAGKDIVIKLLNGNTATVNVTETPSLKSIEDWEIYNFTEDAHPIHLHLVGFEVIGREVIGAPSAVSAAGQNSPLPWETGFKDTVIAYPGEITTVRANFDIEGLYVWHCHIVEHEDNEMMRPYVVVGKKDGKGDDKHDDDGED